MEKASSIPGSMVHANGFEDSFGASENLNIKYPTASKYCILGVVSLYATRCGVEPMSLKDGTEKFRSPFSGLADHGKVFVLSSFILLTSHSAFRGLRTRPRKDYIIWLHIWMFVSWASTTLIKLTVSSVQETVMRTLTSKRSKDTRQ